MNLCPQTLLPWKMYFKLMDYIVIKSTSVFSLLTCARRYSKKDLEEQAKVGCPNCTLLLDAPLPAVPSHKEVLIPVPSGFPLTCTSALTGTQVRPGARPQSLSLWEAQIDEICFIRNHGPLRWKETTELHI